MRLVTRLFAVAAAMTLGAIAAVPVLNPTAAWRFGQNEGTLSSPSLRNNTVFVGTASGAVHALDRDFGTVLWTAQVIDAVNGSIGFDEIDVTDPTIYVPTITGWVYALDGRTGALVWKRMTEMSGVFVRPAVYNKSVFVDVAHGGIWLLNSTGGLVTTSAGIDPHVQRTADGNVSVFAGSTNGEVWRSNLRLTDDKCWLAPGFAGLPMYRPVAMGPLMIVNDNSSNVYGVDYTECVTRWNRTLPLGAQPSVQGYVAAIDELNIAVVAAANGVVAALDAYSGAIRWITTVTGSEFSTTPVYGDGFVFVLDLSGTIVVLSAADGTVQQRVDGGAATAPWSRMAYRRGVLVASFSSTVAAYTLAARPSPPATRVPTEAPGTASPVASFVTMTHCSAFNCASGCEHVKYPLNSCVALSNSSSVLRSCARSEMRVQSFDGSYSCAAETPSSIKFFQVGQCINDADAGGSFIVDSC